MGNNLRKRGQRFIRKFSRATTKASEEGKEHIKENLFARLAHIGNVKLLVFEWGLLVAALVMLAVAQAFWYAGTYSEDVFSEGGSYTEATLGEVNSMNPLFATTNSERVLSQLMFGTLATNDYSGHPGIGLASSITASEDGKVWTVKLRDNLKWSDGEPITVEDVLFTVDLIKNPRVNTVYDSNLSRVSAKISEEQAVVFTLPTTYADFISALDFPILPKHVLSDVDPETLNEHAFSKSPVTSGAFSFNALQSTSRSDEQVYYLSNNKQYYHGSPLLNSFAIHTYPSKESIIDALNTGAVTATAELQETDAASITAGQFIEKNSSLNSGAFIFFNTKNALLKNATVRAAIRQGIDIERMRAESPNTVRLDYPLLKSQIQLENYPKIPARDVESAKATIAEQKGDNAGALQIVTVNSGHLPAIANDLAEELRNLSLEANVVTYDETPEFITNTIAMRNYDILVYEIELGSDPDLLPYYHSSQASSGGLNLSNYRNFLVDDLLLGARDTTDKKLRIKKYESFLEYWVNEAPAIALYQVNMTYYYNQNVRTFGDDVRLVTPLDRFSDVTDWATSKSTKNKTP